MSGLDRKWFSCLEKLLIMEKKKKILLDVEVKDFKGKNTQLL